MHLVFDNVNDAFRGLVSGIHTGEIETIRTPSRAGEVLQIPEPLTVTYNSPRKRVLFNPYRDANPFFHLYESLWMLAGRNDVAPLAYYNSRIAEIASDDGETFNGAYGYRWRHSVFLNTGDWKAGDDVCPECLTGERIVDQLDVLIKYLQENPGGRRAVLQMWTVEDDLLNIWDSKDVCCNTCVYFSIRDDAGGEGNKTHLVGQNLDIRVRRSLDMTVCNRSNDIIWGMLGANIVHFSFLQEYLANCLGVGVGRYHQFTNNAHVYTERFEPEKWLSAYAELTMHDPEVNSYSNHSPCQIPLVKDREGFDQDKDIGEFDREVKDFVDYHSGGQRVGRRYHSVFLEHVAQPMIMAFHYHKCERDYEKATGYLDKIFSEDWRSVAITWMKKREKLYKEKQL